MAVQLEQLLAEVLTCCIRQKTLSGKWYCMICNEKWRVGYPQHTPGCALGRFDKELRARGTHMHAIKLTPLVQDGSVPEHVLQQPEK